MAETPTAETLLRQVLRLDERGDARGILDALEAHRDIVATSAELSTIHGDLLAATGRAEAAEAAYRRALALDPGAMAAANNLGLLLKKARRWDEAEAALRPAWQRPDAPAELGANLAGLLLATGRDEAARVVASEAVRRDPKCLQAQAMLGSAFGRLGRLDDAVAAFSAAFQLGGAEHPLVLSNAASMLIEHDRLPDAGPIVDKALALAPDIAEVQLTAGNLRRAEARFEAAAEHYARAAALDPRMAQAWSNLGGVRTRQARHAEAVAAYREALRIKPDYAEAHHRLLFALAFADGVSQEEVVAEYKAFDERHAAPLKAGWTPHANTPDPDRRLRVGLIGSEFSRHSNSYGFEPLVTHLPRDGFEVIAYSSTARADDRTAMFAAACDAWHDVTYQNDETVARAIRDDGVDILIDLTTLAAGARPLVAARKPAPVQMDWINATGLSAVDYLISDAVVWPDHAAEAIPETVVHMPRGIFPYAPPADAPAVAPPPCLADGIVRLGSFNAPAKLGAETAALWAEVLRAVPEARLVLKYIGLDDPAEQARLSAHFADHGVAPERIEFIGGTDRASHLAAYGRIDIALDPQPASGGTTTWDALWMGVPVLALRGARPHGRTTASILTHAGLAEWVCETPRDMAEAARRLAADPAALGARRREQRAALAKSPLLDPAAYAADAAAILRDAWRRWCGQ